MCACDYSNSCMYIQCQLFVLWGLLGMHLRYGLSTSFSGLNSISSSHNVVTNHPPTCTWGKWYDQKLMIDLEWPYAYIAKFEMFLLSYYQINWNHDGARKYCQVWLISACAITLSGKETCMRLLDDVRLLGSEILAPPTISMFEHSSTKPARYELCSFWQQLSYSPWKCMIGSHRWQKLEKIAVMLGETRFEVEVKSQTPSQ